jgi:hypothetical protein
MQVPRFGEYPYYSNIWQVRIQNSSTYSDHWSEVSTSSNNMNIKLNNPSLVQMTYINYIHKYMPLTLYPRRHLGYSSQTPTFYQNCSALRNTADVTGGKPIADHLGWEFYSAFSTSSISTNTITFIALSLYTTTHQNVKHSNFYKQTTIDTKNT